MLLYFEYKTYSNQVFKIKETPNSLLKAIEKPDTFNPPENDMFERVGRTIEVLYRGAKVLGTDIMLRWEMCPNMTRPFSDTTKVEMNYAICAPRMYKGRIDSTVNRITGFADMIQLTHLKIQQVLSRMVPDGVFVDVEPGGGVFVFVGSGLLVRVGLGVFPLGSLVLVGTAVLLSILDTTGNLNSVFSFIRDPMTTILAWTSGQAETVSGTLSGPRDLQTAKEEILLQGATGVGWHGREHPDRRSPWGRAAG